MTTLNMATIVHKPVHDVSAIIRCSDFAAKKHKDQRRKDVDKTPYINHPIGM